MENESDDYLSEDEQILLFLLRRRMRRLRAANRKIWTKRWISRRHVQGAFNNLVREINAEDPEKFRQFHRLDRESFEHILGMVSSLICKKETHMRSAIKPCERLSVTLRFLATGETFRSLSFQFRIGERTISQVVEETCQALYITLKQQYMKTPSTILEWLNIAEEFKKKWNYPCCIGAIDGKHIAIQQPSGSGSEFFNYKHFFSVLLLALTDANYKFIYVNVGAAGRAGDAGVYNDSNLKKAVDENQLNLPPPTSLPGITSSTIDYHIIGDDAFAMSKHLMKPYPHRHLDKEKRIFNYRLSRARRVVENAFGILANRWRVFLTTIKLCPEKVTNLILAACCLHNYLVERNKGYYVSLADVENTDHTVTGGSWRSDTFLTAMDPYNTDRNHSKNAKTQRELLTTYFSNHGMVPWQNSMID